MKTSQKGIDLYIITNEQRIYVKHTMALLNSMILSGELHKEGSAERFKKSILILNRLSKPIVVAEPNKESK